jgi:hypothetical protein
VSNPGPELVRSPVESAASPAVAPYHPPPAYPPPSLGRAAPVDGRAITSLAVAIIAIAFGLPFGLPGLTLGPVAYFTGKAAIARIDSSQGTIGGRGLAATGWVLGAVATAIGALVSLAWLVVLLVSVSGPPTG